MIDLKHPLDVSEMSASEILPETWDIPSYKITGGSSKIAVQLSHLLLLYGLYYGKEEEERERSREKRKIRSGRYLQANSQPTSQFSVANTRKKNQYQQ